MNDKEKYLNLAQRYFEAATTPEEERDLFRYVTEVEDPDFDELRGVLGYLSIGREKKISKARKVQIYFIAVAAASIIAILAIGLNLLTGKAGAANELCVRYAYGEQTTDSEQIMAAVESSLSEFFSGDSPAETNLLEMFQR